MRFELTHVWRKLKGMDAGDWEIEERAAVDMANWHRAALDLPQHTRYENPSGETVENIKPHPGFP